MEMPELKLPLNVHDIEACIPHRYPFLLIDRVIALTPNESVVALKSISGSDPILQGHFPGNPVYPGVLLVEGMAQTSAVLGLYSSGKPFDHVLLTEIEKVRFRQKVEPGVVLRYEVKLEKRRGHFFWFTGEAKVNDELVAHVTFSALMK